MNTVRQAFLTAPPELVCPNGMVISYELVTPAQAQAYLDRNNTKNRRVRADGVALYAGDMAAGRWAQYNPTGTLCFDGEGVLVNGQHTLNAIVRSGIAQGLLVARNVDPRTVAAIDRGLRRSVTDIAKFLDCGFESKRATVARIVDRGIPTLGGSDLRATFEDLWEMYERHADVVEFVFSIKPKGKSSGINTTFLAVVARAAYTEDRERLREFVNVVATGISNGIADSGAVTYARYARERGYKGSVRETYRRTQSALRHFLDRAPMTKLYGTDQELFSIPK